MLATQNETAALELRRRYSIEWHAVLGELTALEQRLEDEYPRPDDAGAPVTGYDLDAVRALRGELAALLERG